MNIKKVSNVIGIGSSIGLFSIGVTVLLPTASNQALAEGLPKDSIVAQAAVDVQPVISIGIASSKLDIDLTPKSTGSFDQTSTTLTVSTNNLHGYKIFMQSTNNGRLLNTDASVNSSINPLISNNQTVTDFASNTWGYAITKAGEDSSTYSAVPADAIAIKNAEVANINNADEYTLTLAAKVDTTLPAGSYAGAIILSAIANPIEITSLNQLFYMQDMTPEICANTALDTTKQLIDTRDGNSYWVAKLRDGNCWMTQNLALDITEAGLSASDTDISKDWDQNSEYSPEATERALLNRSDLSKTRSWNLGKYVISNPEYADRCVKEGSSEYISVATGGTMAECARVGVIDVSGSEWKPTFQARWGSWSFNGDYASVNNGISAKPENPYNYFISINTETHEYDPHYLVGNYYMFYTAVAGNNINNAVDEIIDASICPKGWRLPSSGTVNNTKNGSMFNLLSGYGLTSTNPSIGGTYSVTLPNDTLQEYTINPNGYNIIHGPLTYLRSGQVYVPNGGNTSMRWIGSTGMFWTSTIKKQAFDGSSDVTNSYYYEFTYGGIQPNSAVNIYFGFPIRCLSR